MKSLILLMQSVIIHIHIHIWSMLYFLNLLLSVILYDTYFYSVTIWHSYIFRSSFCNYFYDSRIQSDSTARKRNPTIEHDVEWVSYKFHPHESTFMLSFIFSVIKEAVLPVALLRCIWDIHSSWLLYSVGSFSPAIRDSV